MNSVFKQEINSFLELMKQSYSKNTYIHIKSTMNLFDKWLIDDNHLDKTVNLEIINGFIKSSKGKRRTINEHINHINKFLVFLSSLGYSVSYHEKIKELSDYIPYYFTDDDIEDIFDKCDNFIILGKPYNLKSKLIHIEIPMAARIMYGCGARIGETLSLKVNDIDFENGVIRFTHDTKNNKQRLVPIHNTLTNIIKRYCEALSIINQKDAFLFPLNLLFKEHITVKSVSSMFREHILKDIRSNQNLERHQRGACVHQFRHTFALRSFRQFELNGYKPKNMVPILSTYLGHDSLNETEKYLRFSYLLYPEANDAFEEFTCDILPEVNFDE